MSGEHSALRALGRFKVTARLAKGDLSIAEVVLTY